MNKKIILFTAGMYFLIIIARELFILSLVISTSQFQAKSADELTQLLLMADLIPILLAILLSFTFVIMHKNEWKIVAFATIPALLLFLFTREYVSMLFTVTNYPILNISFCITIFSAAMIFIYFQYKKRLVN